MRAFVLALVVSVSPLGPAVCQTACALEDAHHCDASVVSACHRGELVVTGVADQDHDCLHSDQTPALVGIKASMAFAVAVLSPRTGRMARLESMVRPQFAIQTAWSPPQLSPPVPLRL